jgi:hypothetical protein
MHGLTDRSVVHLQVVADRTESPRGESAISKALQILRCPLG